MLVNAGKFQPITFSLSDAPIVITNNGVSPVFGALFFEGVTYQLSPNVWNLDQVVADNYPTALATGGLTVPEGHLSMRHVGSVPSNYHVGQVVLPPEGDAAGRTLPCLFVDIERLKRSSLEPAFDTPGTETNLDMLGFPRKTLAAAMFGKPAGGSGGGLAVSAAAEAGPSATNPDATVVASQGDGIAVKSSGGGIVVDDKITPAGPNPPPANFTR